MKELDALVTHDFKLKESGSLAVLGVGAAMVGIGDGAATDQDIALSAAHLLPNVTRTDGSRCSTLHKATCTGTPAAYAPS